MGAGIIAHAVDVALPNVLTTAQAVDRGIPFVIIAPDAIYNSNHPDIQVIGLPDGSVRTAKDLNGKVVGVRSVAGILVLAMNAWIDQNGGDPSQVKYIEIAQSETIPALQRGTVAAAMVADPLLSQIRGQIRVLGSPLDAFGAQCMVTAWIASSDWVAQNRQTAATFARTIAESARWADDPKNHALMRAYVARYDPTATLLDSTSFSDNLNPKLIQGILDSAVKFKLLQHPMSASKLIVNLA